MKLREEIFKIPTPGYIKVADRPISQKDAVIREIGPEQIKEEFDFEYYEDCTINQSQLSTNIEEDDPYLENIFHRLQNPLNNSLVVCKLDYFGHGLFTLLPIEIGEVIGIYAGEINIQEYNDPTYELGNHLDEFDIKAIKRGGLTRFIQHMPECVFKVMDLIQEANNQDSLYKIAYSLGQPNLFDQKQSIESNKEKLCNIFFSKVKRNCFKEPIIEQLVRESATIGYSNTNFLSFDYKGVELTVVTASRNIQPYEQLGVNYGANYWSNKSLPYLFDRNTSRTSSWSFIYHLFFQRDQAFISNWSWLFSNIKNKILYINACNGRFLIQSEVENTKPKIIQVFLSLNVKIFSGELSVEQIKSATVQVPIIYRTIWISLLQRGLGITFSEEDMIDENMSHCALPPNLLGEIEERNNLPLRVKQYLKEASLRYTNDSSLGMPISSKRTRQSTGHVQSNTSSLGIFKKTKLLKKQGQESESLPLTTDCS
jgi:hypothetical protein